MTGGASRLPVASSGGNSGSVTLVALSGFATGFSPDGLPSGLALASFLSPDLLLDFSAAGSLIATLSSSPSMTTMASAFSTARMPLAAAAQSAGAPFG